MSHADNMDLKGKRAKYSLTLLVGLQSCCFYCRLQSACNQERQSAGVKRAVGLDWK